MKETGFFRNISNKISVEFQNIQNIKTFLLIEIVLFLLGLSLTCSIKQSANLYELVNEIFVLIMITIPVAAIFQAYRIYRKTNWIKIGDKQINVPLYLESIKRKHKNQTEKYSVKNEISKLFTKFESKEKIIKEELKTCNTFREFDYKIIPQLNKLKYIKIPILYLSGKEYVEEPFWYLGLLLRLKDELNCRNDNIDEEIKKYIQSEIDFKLQKYNFDEEEIDHIKKRKDYSKYAVKMNQLVRILHSYYNKYLDNKDNHEELIEKLKKIFEDNPDLDDFVNNTILKINKEESKRWERKIEDLELENYLIMKYRNE